MEHSQDQNEIVKQFLNAMGNAFEVARRAAKTGNWEWERSFESVYRVWEQTKYSITEVGEDRE